MATVSLNGITFKGAEISINKGRIIIDGKDVTPDAKEITIAVDGNIERLQVDQCKKVTVNGSCGSLSTMSGNVDCGPVNGPVKTMSGNVKCGNVGNDVGTSSGDVDLRCHRWFRNHQQRRHRPLYRKQRQGFCGLYRQACASFDRRFRAGSEATCLSIMEEHSSIGKAIVGACANDLLGTQKEVYDWLDSKGLASLGIEEDLEHSLSDHIERCPECDTWCEPGELVDDEGESSCCEQCRK